MNTPEQFERLETSPSFVASARLGNLPSLRRQRVIGGEGLSLGLETISETTGNFSFRNQLGRVRQNLPKQVAYRSHTASVSVASCPHTDRSQRHEQPRSASVFAP